MNIPQSRKIPTPATEITHQGGIHLRSEEWTIETTRVKMKEIHSGQSVSADMTSPRRASGELLSTQAVQTKAGQLSGAPKNSSTPTTIIEFQLTTK